MSDVEVVTLLNSTSVTLDQLMNCNDFINIFERRNADLNRYLAEPEIVRELIQTLHGVHGKQAQKISYKVFTSKRNLAVSSVLFTSVDFWEQIISVFADEDGTAYAKGLVCSFLQDIWSRESDECFTLFSQSKIFYPTLLQHIELTCVSALLHNVIEIQIESMQLVWMAYDMLMGDVVDKPNGSLVLEVAAPACSDSMRPALLDLLQHFFGVFMYRRDFSEFMAQKLPLLMEKSVCDHERSCVFKLGLILPENKSLWKCAVSIVKEFVSSEALVDSALKYIAKCSDKMVTEDLCLLAYRVLVQGVGNFVMNSALNLMKSVARDIVANERVLAVLKHSKPKTIIEKAFRDELLHSADIEISTLSED